MNVENIIILSETVTFLPFLHYCPSKSKYHVCSLQLYSILAKNSQINK